MHHTTHTPSTITSTSNTSTHGTAMATISINVVGGEEKVEGEEGETEGVGEIERGDIEATSEEVVIVMEGQDELLGDNERVLHHSVNYNRETNVLRKVNCRAVGICFTCFWTFNACSNDITL